MAPGRKGSGLETHRVAGCAAADPVRRAVAAPGSDGRIAGSAALVARDLSIPSGTERAACDSGTHPGYGQDRSVDTLADLAGSGG